MSDSDSWTDVGWARGFYSLLDQCEREIMQAFRLAAFPPRAALPKPDPDVQFWTKPTQTDPKRAEDFANEQIDDFTILEITRASEDWIRISYNVDDPTRRLECEREAARLRVLYSNLRAERSLRAVETSKLMPPERIAKQQHECDCCGHARLHHSADGCNHWICQFSAVKCSGYVRKMATTQDWAAYTGVPARQLEQEYATSDNWDEIEAIRMNHPSRWRGK